jgi:GDP-L-fucose synthase
MLSHINVGWGDDVSIAELARAVAKAVGYAGQIVFDTTKPDGTPRKLMDSNRLNSLGWRARVALDEGLQHAYQDFLQTTPRSV